MSMQRFTELAGAWGADPRRWPEAERGVYARFAASAEGARILAEAAALDQALDGLRTRPDDPLRAARIERAARAPQWRRSRIAMASGAWAASAVLGFMLGLWQPGTETDDTELSQMLQGSTVLEDYL